METFSDVGALVQGYQDWRSKRGSFDGSSDPTEYRDTAQVALAAGNLTITVNKTLGTGPPTVVGEAPAAGTPLQRTLDALSADGFRRIQTGGEFWNAVGGSKDLMDSLLPVLIDGTIDDTYLTPSGAVNQDGLHMRLVHNLITVGGLRRFAVTGTVLDPLDLSNPLTLAQRDEWKDLLRVDSAATTDVEGPDIEAIHDTAEAIAAGGRPARSIEDGRGRILATTETATGIALPAREPSADSALRRLAKAMGAGGAGLTVRTPRGYVADGMFRGRSKR